MRKLVFPIFLGLALCSPIVAQQTASNDDVIKLAKAGMSDDIIISVVNSSQGQFDTSPDSLILLKKAGVSDKVVAAMVQKRASSSPAATDAQEGPATITPPTAPANAVPRIFLSSQSKGLNRNADRDQSMEMSKDFERDCPSVKITIMQNAADYTVLLNHIEVGLLVRDNQFQIANRDGDLISKTKEGGSIAAGVKKACSVITADWNNKKQ